MARRGAVLAVIWILVLATLLGGAGMLTSSDAASQTAGLVFLVALGLVMAGVTLLFYVRNRRGQAPPASRRN